MFRIGDAARLPSLPRRKSDRKKVMESISIVVDALRAKIDAEVRHRSVDPEEIACVGAWEGELLPSHDFPTVSALDGAERVISEVSNLLCGHQGSDEGDNAAKVRICALAGVQRTGKSCMLAFAVILHVLGEAQQEWEQASNDSAPAAALARIRRQECMQFLYQQLYVHAFLPDCIPEDALVLSRSVVPRGQSARMEAGLTRGFRIVMHRSGEQGTAVWLDFAGTGDASQSDVELLNLRLQATLLCMGVPMTVVTNVEGRSLLSALSDEVGRLSSPFCSDPKQCVPRRIQYVCTDTFKEGAYTREAREGGVLRAQRWLDVVERGKPPFLYHERDELTGAPRHISDWEEYWCTFVARRFQEWSDVLAFCHDAVVSSMPGAVVDAREMTRRLVTSFQEAHRARDGELSDRAAFARAFALTSELPRLAEEASHDYARSVEAALRKAGPRIADVSSSEPWIRVSEALGDALLRDPAGTLKAAVLRSCSPGLAELREEEGFSCCILQSVQRSIESVDAGSHEWLRSALVELPSACEQFADPAARESADAYDMRDASSAIERTADRLNALQDTVRAVRSLEDSNAWRSLLAADLTDARLDSLDEACDATRTRLCGAERQEMLRLQAWDCRCRYMREEVMCAVDAHGSDAASRVPLQLLGAASIEQMFPGRSAESVTEEEGDAVAACIISLLEGAGEELHLVSSRDEEVTTHAAERVAKRLHARQAMEETLRCVAATDEDAGAEGFAYVRGAAARARRFLCNPDMEPRRRNAERELCLQLIADLERREHQRCTQAVDRCVDMCTAALTDSEGPVALAVRSAIGEAAAAAARSVEPALQAVRQMETRQGVAESRLDQALEDFSAQLRGTTGQLEASRDSLVAGMKECADRVQRLASRVDSDIALRSLSVHRKRTRENETDGDAGESVRGWWTYVDGKRSRIPPHSSGK